MSPLRVLLVAALSAEPQFAFRTRVRTRAQNGEWIADAIQASGSAAAKSSLEFHGEFRDLTLWKEPGVGKEADSSKPLWVIEFERMEEIEEERARAESLGLQVLFERERSLVIQGDVPGKLGYDSCGGNGNKTVVPVANFEVTPRAMPPLDVEKYTRLAQIADPANIALREIAGRSSLRLTLEQLLSYEDRQSYGGVGSGLDQAADWAAKQFASYGFTVERDDFQPGSGWWQRRITPQIVAELRGTVNPERVVVIGAHLDSTAGYFASKAPGADDNGSGSAVLLELARIIGEGGASFKNTLRLCLFTGEEQGLLGSRALAQRWKQEGVDIIAMLNADMVGYRQSGQPITLALMSRNADQDMVNIVRMSSQTYLGDKLQIGITTGCCSDQQSFYENGFPAMGVFETPTSSVVYPHYHRSTDLIQYIDMEQVELHGQALMAAALLFAEIDA